MAKYRRYDGVMVIVTDAFLSLNAQEELDGTLYVEDRIDRAQMDSEGKTGLMALVINHDRPQETYDVFLFEIYLTYPGGRTERIAQDVIHPQKFVSESGFRILGVNIYAPEEGDYVITVRSGAAEVAVPDAPELDIEETYVLGEVTGEVSIPITIFR